VDRIRTVIADELVRNALDHGLLGS